MRDINCIKEKDKGKMIGNEKEWCRERMLLLLLYRDVIEIRKMPWKTGCASNSIGLILIMLIMANAAVQLVNR